MTFPKRVVVWVRVEVPKCKSKRRAMFVERSDPRTGRWTLNRYITFLDGKRNLRIISTIH